MATDRAALRITVITVSDRTAAGQREDRPGAVARQFLGAEGHHVTGMVVPDGEESVRSAVTDAVAAGAQVIFTLGGTGITPRDRTPEALAPLWDRELPGIAEAIRAHGRTQTPMAALSRGQAGVVGSAIVIALPGSPGGVRDGLEVSTPLLVHLVDQLRGGDH